MDCSFCGAKIIVIILENGIVEIHICPNYDGIKPHYPKKEEEEPKKQA